VIGYDKHRCYRASRLPWQPGRWGVFAGGGRSCGMIDRGGEGVGREAAWKHGGFESKLRYCVPGGEAVRGTRAVYQGGRV